VYKNIFNFSSNYIDINTVFLLFIRTNRNILKKITTIYKNVLSMMGVSKESISKFLIGN